MTQLLAIPDGSVAAVVAHPDDESFGLGALLAALAAEGRTVRVLCFTSGEASTIGATRDLGRIRRREMAAAAERLGVADVALLDLPDGGLDTCSADELDARIDNWLDDTTAALIVFEPQGVTGHPDHRAATAAAERIADRRDLPVVEWGLDPVTVARLEEQYDMRFHAIVDGPHVFDLPVGRGEQLEAIQCHSSQLDDDPIVLKRLALQGTIERVRLRRPGSPAVREVE
ncbi:MAG TPA: PIG-L deacetylase family protein [Acidimicrobiia bacterium]